MWKNFEIAECYSHKHDRKEYRIIASMVDEGDRYFITEDMEISHISATDFTGTKEQCQELIDRWTAKETEHPGWDDHI